MYKLKPIFKIPRKLELPDCMYKLNNPVACVTNTIEKENESEVLASVMDKVKNLLKV